MTKTTRLDGREYTMGNSLSRTRQLLPGWLALFVLLTLAGMRSIAAEPFDTLLADYKAYGLPLPPRNAELALLPGPGVTVTNGVRHQDMYVALLLKKVTGKSKAVYWVGCDEGWNWHSIEFRPIGPKAESLRDTAPVPCDHNQNAFLTYPDLALAIQCHAQGWEDVATLLLERSRKPAGREPFKRPPKRPRDDRAALAELAWNYHCNQFVKAAANRRATVAAMKKVLAASAALDTKAHNNVLEDMEKTLAPVHTQPARLDAALEGLLDFQQSWVRSLAAAGAMPAITRRRTRTIASFRTPA